MLELLATWREQPRRFDAQALGVTNRPDDPLRWDAWEAEADRLYLAHGMLAVKSARGIGKTFHWGPRRALHFMLCHAPSIVIVTGPGDRVVKAMMDAIVHHWWPRLPVSIRDSFKAVDGELMFKRNPSLGRIVAFSTDARKREAVKGKRSHNVLIIGDEYSAADDESDRMLVGYLSGNGINRMVLFSQPTRLTGPFHRAFTKVDSPFVGLTVPGSKSHRVSPRLGDNLARTYGKDSAVYRCDWLAEFPSEQRTSFIKAHQVLEAIGRQVEASRARPVWGLDPSGVGADGCPLAIRRGRIYPRIVEFGGAGKEPEAVASEIIEFWFATPEDDKPHAVNVDAGGDVGIVICRKLERAGLPVVRRFFGVPALKYQYKSARTEMYADFREALPTISLPDCPGLVEALTTPALLPVGGGQVSLEDKSDMRKRGGSPDIGDAVVLAWISSELGKPKKEAA